MDETNVELGEPIVVEDVVVRPVARRRVVRYGAEAGGAVFARLVPLGVIVERDGSMEALDLDGEPLADEVLGELPDLQR